MRAWTPYELESGLRKAGLCKGGTQPDFGRDRAKTPRRVSTWTPYELMSGVKDFIFRIYHTVMLKYNPGLQSGECDIKRDGL